MRILLTFAFVLAFSASAYAEVGKIVVHNDDGTVSSVDIEAPALEPSVEIKDKPVNLRVRPELAEPATPAKSAKETVKKSQNEPEKKLAPKKQAAKKDVKKETPVKNSGKKSEKKAAAPKKKKVTPTAKQKTQKKKPSAAKSAPAPDSTPKRPPAAPSSQRLGPQMTPDDAIRIALDVAPPARSVNAHAVNYKGLHAYQVVFDTEDGDRSVFIDRETGKIVK